MGGKHQINSESSLLPVVEYTLTYIRWIYSVFLAIDANFRLKRRVISTDSKDPGLSNGWGYFVDERRYKDYLANSSAVIQEVCALNHDCAHNLTIDRGALV